MARASGGANIMHPLSWGGGTNGKKSKNCLSPSGNATQHERHCGN